MTHAELGRGMPRWPEESWPLEGCLLGGKDQRYQEVASERASSGRRLGIQMPPERLWCLDQAGMRSTGLGAPAVSGQCLHKWFHSTFLVGSYLTPVTTLCGICSLWGLKRTPRTSCESCPNRNHGRALHHLPFYPEP